MALKYTACLNKQLYSSGIARPKLNTSKFYEITYTFAVNLKQYAQNTSHNFWWNMHLCILLSYRYTSINTLPKNLSTISTGHAPYKKITCEAIQFLTKRRPRPATKALFSNAGHTKS